MRQEAVIFVDNANHEQPSGISMQDALSLWAVQNDFACEFIAYKDNDLLAELRKVT